MPVDKNTKKQIIENFAISDQDTGSVEVQVALLTEKIKTISEHFEKNPKDVSSKRGLLLAVSQRRSFLGYLKRKNKEQYKEIVHRLGMRK